MSFILANHLGDDDVVVDSTVVTSLPRYCECSVGTEDNLSEDVANGNDSDVNTEHVSFFTLFIKQSLLLFFLILSGSGLEGHIDALTVPKLNVESEDLLSKYVVKGFCATDDVNGNAGATVLEIESFVSMISRFFSLDALPNTFSPTLPKILLVTKRSSLNGTADVSVTLVIEENWDTDEFKNVQSFDNFCVKVPFDEEIEKCSSSFLEKSQGKTLPLRAVSGITEDRVCFKGRSFLPQSPFFSKSNVLATIGP